MKLRLTAGLLGMAVLLTGCANGVSGKSLEVTEPAVTEESETGTTFGYTGYTGYMDECEGWSYYDSFVNQDYDGDGKTDRIYRTAYKETETCDFRFEMACGDTFVAKNLSDAGSPCVEAVDLDGDGTNEIVLKESYFFSSNPQAEGAIYVIGKQDGTYGYLPYPKELQYRKGDLTPSLQLKQEMKGEQSILVSTCDLKKPFATELLVKINKEMTKSYKEMVEESPTSWSAAYESEIKDVKDGTKQLVLHFGMLDKWIGDEITVTLAYQDGTLTIVDSEAVTW